jgi:hypothetical protein
VLEFDSPTVPFSTWVEKQGKIETFFGPGVRAELHAPAEDKVELALVTVLTATEAQ